MSANNLLVMVIKGSNFTARNCSAECQESCKECIEPYIFSVNNETQALRLAEVELQNNIYEYGLNVIRFEAKEVKKMKCETCGFELEENWMCCPKCGRPTPEETNITPQCTAVLTRSKHSEGYYVDIRYNGKSILALGMDDDSKAVIRSKGLRLSKAPGGRVSFNIFKD